MDSPLILPLFLPTTSNIKALRSQYKDEFEKRHGVKLGFMGAFAKAVAHAVKDQPVVNACTLQ